jgi:hypothetical protein
MNAMKNSKFSLLIYVLAMMFVMYNCKKKEEPFPTKPDEKLVDDLNKIVVAPVTIDPPAPVAATAATAEASAKATAVNGDMANIAVSGTVPASVKTAATEVSAALPVNDVATLTAVTPAMISAIAAGGAPSAELKAVMDKVAANAALQAYLPKFTLPTVAGKTINGRMGIVEPESTTSQGSTIGGVEAVLVDDACLVASEAEFQKAKTKLDGVKTQKDADVAAAYAAVIAPLAAEETACKAGIPATFATYRAAIQVQIAKGNTDLEAAKTVLGDLYPVLVALINIQAIGAYSGLNTLQAASVAACTATTTAKTTNATAARVANLAKVKAAYDAAIAEATAAKAKLLASCHNQGGGN